MIFLTFFKTLEGQRVTIELKNDLCVSGVLESVDQFLNLKLGSVAVVDKERFPQLVRAALRAWEVWGGRAPPTGDSPARC